MRRTRHRSITTAPLIVLLAAMPVVGLTGCGPSEPMPAPTPTGTVTRSAPLFATDEEALDAAEQVYRKYLEVVDAGADPDALRSLATPDTIAGDQATHHELAVSGRHLEGSTILRSMELQQFDGQMLVAYACLLISGVRVVDSNGQDVTPTDRPDQGTLEVTFIVENERLLVAESSLWSTSC